MLVDFRHFTHDGIEQTAKTRWVDSRDLEYVRILPVSFWSRFVSLARIEMKKRLKQDRLSLEHLKRLIQFRASSKYARLVLVDFRNKSLDGIEKNGKNKTGRF